MASNGLGRPKKLEAQMEALRSLSGKSVEVGWFESDRYPNGLSVAEVARWNEFGNSKIPARPAMRLASVNFEAKKQQVITRIARQMVEGNKPPDQALFQIGALMKGEIVKAIRDGGWIDNAASTIRHKGFNKPLIESHLRFKSVSIKVS